MPEPRPLNRRVGGREQFRNAEPRFHTAWTRLGREPRRGSFVQRAAEASNITLEALLCGDPWRTWRGPPLGEMVLNR
jgi:hypothetical protein